MHGHWRLFRHESGRVSGPPAWAYVALFAACMAVGLWSARTFDAVVIWPANGVMLAAYLQLHRRKAVAVLGACVAINLFASIMRGDPMPFLWLNVASNLGQVLLAGILGRRVGGAALDLRRPSRLIRFALLAVVPAVLASALVMVNVAAAVKHYSPPLYLFTAQRFFVMELLGLLIAAPALLLIARAHRLSTAGVAGRGETLALMALLTAVTLAVFGQDIVPSMFLVYPFILLIAFRLSPTWVAVGVILVATIGGTATVTDHGPVHLMHLTPVPGLEAVPPVMRKLSVFYLFLLTIVFTALPLSTVSAARRALIQRLRDRTEAAHAARRRAEEAHAAKSRFLALMSHEMRTPLNSVTGYAEVLARRPALDDEALEQLDQIRASGDAMLRLVEDVLEISRGDDAVIAEPLSLETVITSGAAPGRLAAEARGLDFSIEVRPDAQGPVLGDPRRLRQAIHHLVGNAVKFTEAGWVRILVDRIDGQVLIAVSDSGVGLDPDRIDDLFQPFVQGDDSISRSHGGAGVGLTLVRRHAALMGGDVVARARPGEGSTFTLRLPLPETDRTPAADLARADAIPEALTPRALCVLVVDDHPANREVARLMLRAAGCETVEASDGDEAVALAAAQPFDLILMDVRMPRVDGLTATRAIRALPGPAARTPILAVTADAMSEDAARCLEAGMDAHLAKPISHQALYAAMDRVLSGPDSEADVGISEGAQAA